MDKKKSRVVLLIGNKLWNWNTLAEFKKSKLNVVGVCVYDDKFFGLPFKYIFKSIKKRGPLNIINQILGRIMYKIINFNSDNKRLNEIFNIKECKKISKNIEIPTNFTNSYNSKKTLDFITKLNPNIIVVHSEGWVGKLIRNIPKDGIIIGGHPGITPIYRGAYSSFWAIYNHDENKIGYSVFHIDETVDAGDLIFQEKINISNNDTYMSLDWKGMKAIAIQQVKIIEEYEETNKLSKIKHSKIPEQSNYPIPGATHYIKYLLNQSKVK
jgi:folate-dependent phosphoribosylglycinamide formyltransferase PurN